MKKHDNIDKLLADLHNDLALALLARIRSGEAKASDFKEAREFLKDNHIDAIPKNNNALSQLIDADIPFDVQMI